MDHKLKTGSPDSKFINVQEDYEVAYWAKVLDVTKEELEAAVEAAGTSIDAVKEHLNK